MHSVVETLVYRSEARKIGVTEFEQEAICEFLARNPTAGDEIKGTGGARKLRFAKRGKGKSGGYRIVTFYSGTDIPVFLMSIYAKGQKVNLTQAERNILKRTLATFVETYRQGVTRYVQSRKRSH